MRHISQQNIHGLGSLPAKIALTAFMAFILFGGCQAEDALAPSTGSLTCDGNGHGWYCVINPVLSVDPADGLYDNERVRCDDFGNILDIDPCPDVCAIKPPGKDDLCEESVSTTCDGNMDKWYCATNPELNKDPNDEIYDTDLIHCDGFEATESSSCPGGCIVNSSNVDDRCDSTTCDGNMDKWYCATNPELNKDPNDEIYDTDLIHCDGFEVAEVGSCPDGCTINSSPTDDVCQGGSCGNGTIEGYESCDLSNMNGHTCVTEGFDGGTVGCTTSCMLNTAGCCHDSCTGTVQCVGNVQQTCQVGTSGCSEWVNTGTCTQSCTTEIASSPCFTWTSSAGGMYEIFEICAEKAGDNRLKIHVRKNPPGTFGTRYYGLRVFGVSDPECSHSTYGYNEPTGGVSVSGYGTSELIIEFDVAWAAGQTSKCYCAFAKTQSGDPGYSSSSDEQKIWWYSRRLIVNQVCN